MSVPTVPLQPLPETAPSLELVRPPQEGVFGPSELVQGDVLVGQERVEWSLRVPENPSYDGIALFVPGYIGVHKSSSPIQSALAEQGIATLAYAPARYGEATLYDCMKDPQALHVATLQALVADLIKQEVTIKQSVPGANRVAFDRYMLVMHSMGGLSGPRFALTMPSGIDVMQGLAAVGFGHPTMAELAVDLPRGIIGSLRHEVKPAIIKGHFELSLHNFQDVYRYYQNLGRFMCEGWDCCRSKPVIAEVDELADKGVPYHYLAFERDMLVRADPTIARFVTSHAVMPNYGHLAPQVKATQVAHHVATKLPEANAWQDGVALDQ